MDKKAMEKVREFDKKVRQDREYSEGFYKFSMLFCQLMGLFMIWFGQSTNSKQIFIWMISYVSFVCTDLNMYAGAYEKGKKICVYELLEYLPVNKMDIFRVRLGYLKNKMKKHFLVMLLFQVFIIVEEKKIGVENFLIPLLTVVVTIAVGAMSMYPFQGRKKA